MNLGLSQPVAGTVRSMLVVSDARLTENLYPAGLFLPRHAHDKSYLTFIASGHYREQIVHRTQDVRPNTVRYLPAGEPHLNDYQAGALCLQVELGPVLLHKLAEAHTEIAPGEVRSPAAGWIGARLYGEFRERDALSELAIEGLIYELVATAARIDHHGRRRPAWLKLVEQQLRETYMKTHSLHRMAEEVGVHRVHLCREFRRQYGCTVGEYVRKLRTERACELLREGRLSLAEIAIACGFFDQSHLSVTFKKLTGTSPARYRRMFSGDPVTGVM